jgi:ABC-2 type transport system ATP-binding protein
LTDVSFRIRPGEVLGLIGPNGSGKTTLFECLANVLPRDGGHITSNGRKLTPTDVTDALFYLPDGVTPWPSERVDWLLDYTIGYFRGRAELRDAVIEWFQLETLLSARMGTLSKGQRKRALLALGVLTPQPVLLADEPFDGLDLRQSRDVAGTLRGISRSGRTLFLSIHQINEASRVCDRFVLLSAGQVRGEGTLDELAARTVAGGLRSNGNLEEVFLALT